MPKRSKRHRTSVTVDKILFAKAKKENWCLSRILDDGIVRKLRDKKFYFG